MTEAEWLAGDDAIVMLEAMREAVGKRKIRFLLAACCRRGWHLLDADGRALVEAAERYTDGLIGDDHLMNAVEASRGTMHIPARTALDYAALGAYRIALSVLAEDCGLSESEAAERAIQARLLREVAGPTPFRTVPIDPGWRTPAVLSLASAAWEERVATDPGRPGWLELDRERLCVLSDALEEAGCADAALLSHLRSPGPHVRGCWAVDLVLGLK